MGEWVAYDFFAGLRGWSRKIEERPNWRVMSTDIDKRFDVTLHADILELTASDLISEYGKPDIVLASPPCEKFAVTSLSRYWWVVERCRNCEGPVLLVKRHKGGNHEWIHQSEFADCSEPFARISKDPVVEPKNDEARYFMNLVEHTLKLIEGLQPKFWVMENPTGMMRRLEVLKDVELRPISYCRYGMPYMKPTDLWGGFPPSLKLKPVCRTRPNQKNPLQGQKVEMPDGRTFITNELGEPCHESASRGARTGIQGITDPAVRSLVPGALSDAVIDAAERDLTRRRVVRRKPRG